MSLSSRSPRSVKYSLEIRLKKSLKAEEPFIRRLVVALNELVAFPFPPLVQSGSVRRDGLPSEMTPEEVASFFADEEHTSVNLCSSNAEDGSQFWCNFSRTHLPWFALRIGGPSPEILKMTSVLESLIPDSSSLLYLNATCLTYTFWQTMHIIRQYEHLYGSSAAFRRLTFGVPAMNQMQLDISQNPGRAIRLADENFSIASEMWLGPSFWDFVPCTKQEVLTSDVFIEKRDTPNYLYLKSWPHPFTRPDGEQGRVQQKLWRLLYHQDCEWPPCSGGISETPIGGPPELMP